VPSWFGAAARGSFRQPKAAACLAAAAHTHTAQPSTLSEAPRALGETREQAGEMGGPLGRSGQGGRDAHTLTSAGPPSGCWGMGRGQGGQDTFSVFGVGADVGRHARVWQSGPGGGHSNSGGGLPSSVRVQAR
jgi:hypothetical protein